MTPTDRQRAIERTLRAALDIDRLPRYGTAGYAPIAELFRGDRDDAIAALGSALHWLLWLLHCAAQDAQAEATEAVRYARIRAEFF